MKTKHIIFILGKPPNHHCLPGQEKGRSYQLRKKWMGKEILFPKNSVFTIRGTDTIDFALNVSDYKIVSYIDTAGCSTCQLKLAEWQRFMNEVELSTRELDFGTFPKEEQRTREILFKNVGDKPFVIYDVVTSCGCTKVDYPKAPIPPGGTLKFTVTYDADKPGHFNKSLKVYGNMEGSPLKLLVKGEAH